MRILVLSPHTDDAELGAGGTICRFIEEKHEIMWIAFSIAEDSLPQGYPKDALKLEFRDVLSFLNIENFLIENLKVRYFHEKRQEILELLVKTRNSFKPDLVLTTSTGDVHQDHAVVTQEAVRAFKNCSSIIGYELPWNCLETSNNMSVRLEKRHIDMKMEILQFYKTQVEKERKYFSEDFIRSSAIFRGIQCLSEYAESFEVIKWMI